MEQFPPLKCSCLADTPQDLPQVPGAGGRGACGTLLPRTRSSVLTTGRTSVRPGPGARLYGQHTPGSQAGDSEDRGTDSGQRRPKSHDDSRQRWFPRMRPETQGGRTGKLETSRGAHGEGSVPMSVRLSTTVLSGMAKAREREVRALCAVFRTFCVFKQSLKFKNGLNKTQQFPFKSHPDVTSLPVPH